MDDVVGIAYTKDLMHAERNGRGDHADHASSSARPVHAREQAGQPADARDAGREVPPGYGRRRVRRRRPGWSRSRTASRSWSARSSTNTTRKTPEVQRLPDGDYSVDGGMSIDDLNDLLDLGLPDEDWETVARVPVRHARACARGRRVRRPGWLALHRDRGRGSAHTPRRGQPRERPSTPRRWSPTRR